MRKLRVNPANYREYVRGLKEGERVYRMDTSVGEVLAIREAGEARCDFIEDAHEAIVDAAFYSIEDVTGKLDRRQSDKATTPTARGRADDLLTSKLERREK